MLRGNVVVVVEDDPLLRLDAATLLEDAGFEVFEFESADAALGCIETLADQVCAVFTDVHLPPQGLNGFDLADLVHRHWPDISVLVTSGRARPTGPLPTNVRFVPKPWLPLDVLTAIQMAHEGEPQPRA